MNKSGTAKYMWTVVVIVALFSFLVLTPKGFLTGNAITGMDVAPQNLPETCNSDSVCTPFEKVCKDHACVDKVDVGGICNRKEHCISGNCDKGNHVCLSAEPDIPSQEPPQGGQGQGVSHSVDQITGLREALGNAGGSLMAILSPDLDRRGLITEADISNQHLSLEAIDGDGEPAYELNVRGPNSEKESIRVGTARNAYVSHDLSVQGITRLKQTLESHNWPAQGQAEVPQADQIPGPFCVLKYGPTCPAGFNELSAGIDAEDENNPFCNTQPNLGVSCSDNKNPSFSFCCQGAPPFVISGEAPLGLGDYTAEECITFIIDWDCATVNKVSLPRTLQFTTRKTYRKLEMEVSGVTSQERYGTHVTLVKAGGARIKYSLTPYHGIGKKASFNIEEDLPAGRHQLIFDSVEIEGDHDNFAVKNIKLLEN